jgi:hypothetical protein
MPDSARAVERERDPYAWALAQAAILAKGGPGLKGLDLAGLTHVLEEAADEMLATVRSQIVNLMARAAKVAFSANPDIIGHWRSECVEFHDRIIEAYRPSMLGHLDIEDLWRRAKRKVIASFADHGEARPALPSACPFRIEVLVDKDLDVERLIAILAGKP